MADGNSPLFINPTLSAIAIKYRQAGFVADDIMPRMNVDHQEFYALKDRMADWITPPDTTVGRLGKPHQLANSFQDQTLLATANQGLDEPVPNQDAMNGPSESALARATQRVMSLVMMRRELRVAAVVANSSNYNDSTTLSGTSQWSDRTNSNPLNDLLTYLDKPFIRPNTLVMGRDVWTQLCQHPKIISSLSMLSVAAAKVSQDQVAALLEVDRIIVGNGWYNTAAKGQAVSKSRIWGKFCAGVYLGQNGSDAGNTWGYTAQFGARVAGTYQDPTLGLFGGVYVRAGESVKEVVAAPEFGFLISGAVA